MPHVYEVALAELRVERSTVQARLDAIELSIRELERLVSPRVGSGKAGWKAPSPVGTTAAAERRAVLLDVLAKFPGGAALRQLRELTPGFSGKERSNALQSLKVDGAVMRKKGKWLKA